MPKSCTGNGDILSLSKGSASVIDTVGAGNTCQLSGTTTYAS